MMIGSSWTQIWNLGHFHGFVTRQLDEDLREVYVRDDMIMK